MPLITRRSSTRALPRVSVGRCGLIFENCAFVSQNWSRLIYASFSEAVNHATTFVPTLLWVQTLAQHRNRLLPQNNSNLALKHSVKRLLQLKRVLIPNDSPIRSRSRHLALKPPSQRMLQYNPLWFHNPLWFPNSSRRSRGRPCRILK